jgi:hypothetical protein
MRKLFFSLFLKKYHSFPDIYVIALIQYNIKAIPYDIKAKQHVIDVIPYGIETIPYVIKIMSYAIKAIPYIHGAKHMTLKQYHTS